MNEFVNVLILFGIVGAASIAFGALWGVVEHFFFEDID
jgi:hypothetical protein